MWFSIGRYQIQMIVGTRMGDYRQERFAIQVLKHRGALSYQMEAYRDGWVTLCIVHTRPCSMIPNRSYYHYIEYSTRTEPRAVFYASGGIAYDFNMNPQRVKGYKAGPWYFIWRYRTLQKRKHRLLANMLDTYLPSVLLSFIG